MILSLSDFIRECIKSYTKDVLSSSGDTAGLEIFVNSKNRFIQINNKVYAEEKPSLLVEVIPFTVENWTSDIADDLKVSHNIITTKSSKKVKVNPTRKVSQPQIGIFYFIPKKLTTLAGGSLEFITRDVDSECVHHGNFFSSPYLHINMWENMKVKYPFYERFSYTCVPRGRVIYDSLDDCFCIITDRCLMGKTFVNRIVSAFHLPKDRVKVFDEPNHYDCYRCNEDLDIEDYEVF